MGKIMKFFKTVSLWTLIVGGLNWGSTYWLDFDLVKFIGGMTTPAVSATIYTAEVAAAAYMIYYTFAKNK